MQLASILPTVTAWIAILLGIQPPLASALLLSLKPGTSIDAAPEPRPLERPPRAPSRRSLPLAINHTQIFCQNETDPTIYTDGDPDTGGPGIVLTNYDGGMRAGENGSFYFVYESNHDAVPYKYTLVPPFTSIFLTVCPTFEGRIVRGLPSVNLDGLPHNLGTWAELNWYPGTVAWGDISLLQGNDGAALVQALDETVPPKTLGFDQDLITGAPTAALAQKPSGGWCLAALVGSGEGGEGGNQAALDWQLQWLSPWSVYLENGVNAVIDSGNGRFGVLFYGGVV